MNESSLECLMDIVGKIAALSEALMTLSSPLAQPNRLSNLSALGKIY
jgi:hypothetical protein